MTLAVTEARPILLIVDDSDLDRIFFSELVKSGKHPFGVLEADSYDSAVTLLQSVTPTCCLIDYQLPADNGLDLLKVIKKMEHGNNIPVIIMTGEGNEAVAVDAMRNGAEDYLIKSSVTAEILRQSINNAVHTNELQNKLRYLAHYDNLTGLLNRSLFMDRLQITIDQCNRYQQSCSLLYIDVDNFKHINDQFGHEAGDNLLKAVGERIKQNCRVTDSPARLGGDEFAILLSHIDEINTQRTAEKILQQVSEPVYLDSQRMSISLSIGIAHYPQTANDAEDLIRQADEAMYRAKKTGKAQYFQFTAKQKQIWERQNRLESRLPKAIEQNELQLAFQPIIDTQQECLHSLEVLVRWFPDGDEITAAEVIEMVDRLGLFDPFHIWLIDTSLNQLHRWQQLCPDLNVCLNIPANQCHNGLVVDCLRKAMETYQIKPQNIELEITETTLMKHPSMSHELLLSMQGEGVSVAVDDFGTGYSSMAYLTSLPLNTLKIDQRFLIGADADDDSRSRKVIEAITALGHSLGLKVVAEGVETQQQYELIQSIGCDYVQGFYFAEPQLGNSDWFDFISQYPMLNQLITDPDHNSVPLLKRSGLQ